MKTPTEYFFYDHTAGAESGPFGMEQLKSLYASGAITDSTDVRRAADAEWSKLPDLIDKDSGKDSSKRLLKIVGAAVFIGITFIVVSLNMMTGSDNFAEPVDTRAEKEKAGILLQIADKIIADMRNEYWIGPAGSIISEIENTEIENDAVSSAKNGVVYAIRATANNGREDRDKVKSGEMTQAKADSNKAYQYKYLKESAEKLVRIIEFTILDGPDPMANRRAAVLPRLGQKGQVIAIKRQTFGIIWD